MLRACARVLSGFIYFSQVFKWHGTDLSLTVKHHIEAVCVKELSYDWRNRQPEIGSFRVEQT